MCKDKIIKSTPVACFLSSIKKWEVFTCRDLTDSIGSLAEDGRGLVSRHASKPIQLLYTWINQKVKQRNVVFIILLTFKGYERSKLKRYI